MHLAARLRPDPLGELTALPRPPSWILAVGTGKGGEGNGGGEGMEGRKRRGRGNEGGGTDHLQ